MKLCLCQFSGQSLHCSKTPRGIQRGSKTPRGKEQRLRNSAGQVFLHSLPQGGMELSFFARRSFDPLFIAPNNWSNATFAPQTQGDIVSGAKRTTKKKQFKKYTFLNVIFVNHCHFRYLYNQYDHFYRIKYIAER